MNIYKRNQVEEAIVRLADPAASSASPEWRTRMKRLLDTDRALGRVRRSADPEKATYAFYSDEPPGSGVEVWFTEYEAFAVSMGLRLIGHGWPQSFAVRILRRARPELEIQHARTLKQDPKELFDQEAIRRNAKEGDMAFDTTDPVLLTIVSKSAKGEEPDSIDCAVRRGPQESMKWAWEAGRGTGSFTMFEITTTAHALKNKLNETEPRQRGRGK